MANSMARSIARNMLDTVRPYDLEEINGTIRQSTPAAAITIAWKAPCCATTAEHMSDTDRAQSKGARAKSSMAEGRAKAMEKTSR